MTCISSTLAQTQGLGQAMCHADLMQQKGHTDVACACYAAAPSLLADVCPLLADVSPLRADVFPLPADVSPLLGDVSP